MTEYLDRAKAEILRVAGQTHDVATLSPQECRDLLSELAALNLHRADPGPVPALSSMRSTVRRLAYEVERAGLKYGGQVDVPIRPETFNPCRSIGIPSAAQAAADRNMAFATGEGTWGHIIVAELAEAMEADDPEDAAAELAQVAATAMRAAHALDTQEDS